MMKTRVVGLILIAVAATISLGIYMIHRKEIQNKKQIIINEINLVNHNKNINMNITVESK